MEPEEVIQMPVIGEKAPEFDALTTHGRLKLSDLKGKWVILFSHPADFTPVCTTFTRTLRGSGTSRRRWASMSRSRSSPTST